MIPGAVVSHCWEKQTQPKSPDSVLEQEELDEIYS